MRWLELAADVDREAVEAVSAIFREHGHSGVIVEEPVLSTSDWAGWESDPGRPVTIRTYLPVEPATSERREAIERALWHVGQIRTVSPVRARELDETDWAEAWKQHYDVHRIGEHIVIRPSWREFTPQPGDVVVELDPGMAFGTGLHPTTRLCLAALEGAIRPGDTVLDLGAGSGILSIAASKLGASQVLAVDTDPVAVDAATNNVAANSLTNIAIQLGSIDATQQQYDLILANISARVILQLASDLAEAIVPGGRLVASGFLDETEIEVALTVAAAGFHLTESASDGDWRMLVFVRDTIFRS